MVEGSPYPLHREPIFEGAGGGGGGGGGGGSYKTWPFAVIMLQSRPKSGSTFSFYMTPAQLHCTHWSTGRGASPSQRQTHTLSRHSRAALALFRETTSFSREIICLDCWRLQPHEDTRQSWPALTAPRARTRRGRCVWGRGTRTGI